MLRHHVPTVHVDEAARQLTAPAEGLRRATRIAAVFEHSEIELDDLGLKRPSLDSVFLHLTGHKAETPSRPPRSGRHSHGRYHQVTAGELSRPELKQTGLRSRWRSSVAYATSSASRRRSPT